MVSQPSKLQKLIPPEEVLLGNLDTIDLHHGSYSADAPYTVLMVVGASLTERLKTALTDLGFGFDPSYQ